MHVILHDKILDVSLSRAAERALEQRGRPLVVEMELLFSCLLRKRVHFGEAAADATPVDARLAVRFKPIMTKKCSVAEGGGHAAVRSVSAGQSASLCTQLAAHRLPARGVGGHVRLRGIGG
jgi:hypothetical protein